MADSIQGNIAAVQERIARACRVCGRQPQDVTLIAVSKTVEPERVAEAFEAGVRHFGENKVQELLRKRAALDLDCTWHLIGHLQSNKVRDALTQAHLIHSVDSVSLAAEINRRAGNQGVTAHILAQINISHEESKSGVNPAEAVAFAQSLGQFEHIRVEGIMTIALPTEDPEQVRPMFRAMKRIFDEVAQTNTAGNVEMKYLSMGMSHDFEVAIEEGSNMVRVGTAIFGARSYPTA